jgi:hypothetical protein
LGRLQLKERERNVRGKRGGVQRREREEQERRERGREERERRESGREEGEWERGGSV